MAITNILGMPPSTEVKDGASALRPSQQEFYVPLKHQHHPHPLHRTCHRGHLLCHRLPAGKLDSNPIKICVDRLEGLSRGDLQSSVPQLDTKDETASLLSALNTTIGQLEEIVSDVSYHLGKMAAGDFREDLSVQYTGDFVSIQTSMQGIQASLNHTLTRISQAADTVSSSADQVAARCTVSEPGCDRTGRFHPRACRNAQRNLQPCPIQRRKCAACQ